MSRCARAAVSLFAAATVHSQGIITTVAGTAWTFPPTPLAAVNAPLGGIVNVAVDKRGNVYISDPANYRIFQMTPSGTLTVVAGNGIAGPSGDGGPATSASVDPGPIAVDPAGNLYIADGNNIRRVSGGVITTVVPTATTLPGDLNGLAVDAAGNIYFSNTTENVVRRASGGTITTVAGNGTAGFSGDGGPATAASLDYPWGLAVDPAGNLYISELNNFRIRKVSGGVITTVAGNGSGAISGDGGPATSASIGSPSQIAVDAAGNLYISETYAETVREISGGVINTVAGHIGSGIEGGFSGDGGPATSASVSFPEGVAVDGAGNLYIADSGNKRVRKVAGGIITTAAGNGTFQFAGDGGPAVSASLDFGDAAFSVLNFPCSIGLSPARDLYIADCFNNRVRKVSNGNITTVAGNGAFNSGGAFPQNLGDGGPATSAAVGEPVSMAVDSSGNLYITDYVNQRIRKVTNGIITTVAGNGTSLYPGDGVAATSAGIVPRGLAVDSANNVYFIDGFNVRKVTNGIITTIGGNGQLGFSGDGGPATSASLGQPTGIALDSAGNLYIADTFNCRVRKIAGGIITTVAGNGLNCASSGGYSGDGGSATSAMLSNVGGVAVDSTGNLYIADTDNNVIRKVTNGIITTIAGNRGFGFSGDGGLATQAELSYPQSVAVDTAGNVYIADNGNNRIREVLAGPPSLTITSGAVLTFSATAGGAAPPAQSTSINSTVPGLPFIASSNAPWLSVTPSNGTAPASLQVSVDPSQLSASDSGAIIISDAAGLGLRVSASVTFNVSPAAPGKLGVSAPSLTFSAIQGSSSTSSQLTVSNQGSGSIAFTATASTSTGGNWLAVSPASGTVTPNAPVSLTVTAAPGSLAAGTYSGSIVLNSATAGSVAITATLSISSAQQNILLSQTGLSFVSVAQGGAPLPQAFGILNTGQGSMSWSASASTLPQGGSWLTIDQSGGTVAAPYTSVSLVNVSVNPAGLPSGNYYGQIQVTAPGAPNSPQFVSVSLNVLAAGSNPGAEVRPTGLIFIGQPGSSPGSQNVMISNPQASDTTFAAGFLTLPTGGNWAQVLPLNATVQANNPVSMLVQPNYASLTSGVYQGFVSLGFADGSSRSVHVLAVVAPTGATPSLAADGTLAAQAAGSCAPIKIQPTSLTDPGSSVTIGAAASLQVRAVDSCGNLITSMNGSVSATFNDGDAAVSLVHEGNGNWSGTWTPRNGASTQVQVNYTGLEGSGVSLLTGTANITVAVKPAGTTPLTFGAANAASGLGAYISPGGLVSIYGQQLASQAVTSGSPPFPKNINGTQVLLGGIALPLRYVGGGQINAQVPFGLGINTQQQLIVQNGTTLSVPQSVVVAAAQPGIYTQDQSGAGPGVIVDANTNMEVKAGSPAHIGDTLVIYCNGLGATNPAVPTGTPAPSIEPLARTASTTTVTIGNVNAVVEYAGLAPGFPDLYQVNAVVPLGVTPGSAVPIVLTVAGQSSPSTVTITVE